MRHSFNNVVVYFAFQVRQFLIFALLVSGAIHVSPVASAAAICTPTGSGTCYYVSPSGSDANSGTSASPFQTIGHAASVVNPGDMVIVEDGLYHEALNLTRGGTPNAYITFVSQNKWRAVIDGNNNLAEGVQFSANYIRFQGFEIRGFGTGGSGDAFSNYPGGQFIDIAQNYIHDIGRLCTDTTNSAGTGIFLEAPNVVIEQNLIADIGRFAPGENGCNPTTAYYQNHDHGIYIDTNSNYVTIKNNIFYRIERGWPIQVYPSGLDSLAILNNTFVGANPYRVGHIILANGGALTNLRIENNISYNPTTAFIYFSSTSAAGTIANNLIFNGAVGDSMPSGINFSGNLANTDPQLVNPGNSIIDSLVMVDAHLTNGSPAIDTGLSIPDVTNDYEGASRPQGPAYDIGAYEFGGTPTSPPLPTPPPLSGCVNPPASVLASNFAAPCPDLSISSQNVVRSTGTLTITTISPTSATTVGTTIYISGTNGWTPYTVSCPGSAFQGWCTNVGTLTLSGSALTSLPIGSVWIVGWDWTWNGSCFVGPGSTQCNQGQWRLQMVSLQ